MLHFAGVFTGKGQRLSAPNYTFHRIYVLLVAVLEIVQIKLYCTLLIIFFSLCFFYFFCRNWKPELSDLKKIFFMSLCYLVSIYSIEIMWCCITLTSPKFMLRFELWLSYLAGVNLSITFCFTTR